MILNNLLIDEKTLKMKNNFKGTSCYKITSIHVLTTVNVMQASNQLQLLKNRTLMNINKIFCMREVYSPLLEFDKFCVSFQSISPK